MFSLSVLFFVFGWLVGGWIGWRVGRWVGWLVACLVDWGCGRVVVVMFEDVVAFVCLSICLCPFLLSVCVSVCLPACLYILCIYIYMLVCLLFSAFGVQGTGVSGLELQGFGIQGFGVWISATHLEARLKVGVGTVLRYDMALG